MDTNKVNALSTHLEQEISWITELNALLVEEKEILATRQFDLLEEFANKKQALSFKLEESAQQRMYLINPKNQAPALALKEYLRDCSTAETQHIHGLNNKLAECLNRCRELNTVNGQVIANNMYIRQEIVNALSENKPDAVNVYTSQGNIKSTNGNRHHEEA